MTTVQGVMLTLAAMYNYNSTVLDTFELPSVVVRDDFLNLLIFETSELNILYSDPYMFKHYVGLWSKTRVGSWEKMFDLWEMDYNPIHNYDRTEARGLHHSYSENANKKVTADTSNNTTQDLTNDTTTHNDTTNVHSVAAFNTNTGMVDSYRDTGNANGTSNSRDSGTIDSIGNLNSVQDDTANGEYQDKENIRAYGNIGITTTQALMKEELEIRQINLYNIIIDEFKKQFCIEIY